MKFLISTAVAAAALALSPGAHAQDADVTEESAEATAKFTLDTPIQDLVADEKAKAVLDADMPGLTTHASYESFKGMSLREVQPYSGGVITDEILAKIEADLAEIK